MNSPNPKENKHKLLSHYAQQVFRKFCFVSFCFEHGERVISLLEDKQKGKFGGVC